MELQALLCVGCDAGVRASGPIKFMSGTHFDSRPRETDKRKLSHLKPLHCCTGGPRVLWISAL